MWLLFLHVAHQFSNHISQLFAVNPLRIALFIPCYIDQFYPHVGLATLSLLEQFGQSHAAEIEYPRGQTCCGQPMANTGCTNEARPLAERFLRTFSAFDYVVCPSGSCTAMVRHHYDEYLAGKPGFDRLRSHTYELCEFLVDILGVSKISHSFPYRVGLHQSCHGLRDLRLAQSSELRTPIIDKTQRLLESLEGIKLTELSRPDECCGFGGTFAVNEEAVSCMMGEDRIHDHEQAGTQILTANDMSCLMHLDGLIRRQNKPLQVMHVAEILAGHQPRELQLSSGNEEKA